MLCSDVSRFTTIMAGIGELYGKNISALLTDIYWRTLKGYEFEDVQKAFQAHIINPDCGQFFPKPSDIVRYIEGSGETKALLAWAKVEKAIVQIGSYQSVAFDDPLIHVVLEDMGGWVKLCSKNNSQMPFCANEFQKRYMDYVNKKPKRHPKYLLGIIEYENVKNGYAIEAPLLIGDPGKAEEVIKSGKEAALFSQHPNQLLSQHILGISKSCV